MKGEFVTFPARDGWLLEGFLVPPARRPRTALVFLHGMTSFFWSQLDVLAPVAARAGLAYFTFNNRGASLLRRFRHARKPGKRLVAGTARERFEDCLPDIEGALAFLRKRGFRAFILAGHSTGCQKILYYQYKRRDRRVKGLALLAPADDLNLAKRNLRSRFPRVLARARAMVRSGRGHDLLGKPKGYDLFSAARFYHLHRAGSTEGGLFDYTGDLPAVRGLRVPIFAAFGRREQHAVILPARMLAQLHEANPRTTTALVPGDHAFKGGEPQLQRALAAWIREVTR